MSYVILPSHYRLLNKHNRRLVCKYGTVCDQIINTICEELRNVDEAMGVLLDEQGAFAFFEPHYRHLYRRYKKLNRLFARHFKNYVVANKRYNDKCASAR